MQLCQFLFLFMPSTNPQAIEGSYGFFVHSQTTLTIAVNGEAVTLQQSGRDAYPLQKIANNHYEIYGAPVQIKFTQEDGKTSLTLIQNGQERTFQKMEDLRNQYEQVKHTLREHGLADAILMNDLESVKILIKAGADVMALDQRPSLAGKNGRRPLNWAAIANNQEIIRTLIEAGADLNSANLSGFTPLHHAAEYGSLEAAKVLIELGAKNDVKTNSDRTPLEIAAAQDHRELVELFENL